MPEHRSWKRWGAFALLVAVLHFGWEMVQSRWFASMEGLSVWSATLLCARATLGDVGITAVSFALAALAGRGVHWPAKQRYAFATAVFISVGLAITAGYEIFALLSGRWHYSEQMPTIAGIGLIPLLQWIFLPLAEVAAFRLLWRRVEAMDRQSE